MPDTLHAPTALIPIAERIWDAKYRLKDADGTALDSTVEASWDRVARALAAAEAEPEVWAPRFREALDGFKFIPAGRVLAGAGTGRRVTLFNCFVMGTIPDDLGGIFEHLREAALTMQQGGGIGYDFSTLRPAGAPVRGVGSDASGPVSFMDVWDAMCRTIMSAGARRGAMMACLRCDHPDVEAFVDAKADPARLRNFNVSVLVTDAFIEAVRDDAPWDLVFEGQVHRTLPARALWDRIMRATYDHAEPGVIFVDRINATNNLRYAEIIAATNPCGEQPLPPYGACLLGSVNLAALVRDPFGEGAALDEEALDTLVPVAVRMLDCVVDASRFPLEAQAEEARAKRRIGLGVTGLASALAMVGVRYGSEEAAALTARWLRRIARAAYLASSDLAAEKGAFPLFEADALLGAPMLRAMDEDVRDAVRERGLRNALLTSIAPTGTISLLAGNVSSGVEPIFARSYTRRVLERDGSHREEVVEDHAVRVWRERHGDAPLPDHVVEAGDLAPLEHVRMQAAAQEWVDAAISKTVNVPEDIAFDDFRGVYEAAFEAGCKGCTTYRPNAVTGSVLSAAPAPSEGQGDPAAEVADGWPDLPTMRARLRWALTRSPLSEPADLAPAAGVPLTRLLRWMDEAEDVPSAAARRLAAALGVTAGWLVFGEAPSAAPSLPAAPGSAGAASGRDAGPTAAAAAMPPGGPAQEAGLLSPDGAPAEPAARRDAPLPRPQALPGATYKIRWPNSEHALYVTVNDAEVDGIRRPFEVFVNSKNMEHFAWTVALTRMISAVFRRGGEVAFVAGELQSVFDPRGGAWMEGRYVPSILAAIGDVIERHMRAIGFVEGGPLGLGAEPGGARFDAAATPRPTEALERNAGGPPGAAMGTAPPACPSCGAFALHHAEGCATCAACGFSECG